MALEFTQITALTERHFLKKLADGIYNSAAAVARLNKNKKLIDGGHEIIAPVIYSAPGEGGYFNDLDTLSTDRTDNITSSKHAWRQLYEPIRISRKEMLQNNGDAAKLSLIASKMQIAEKNMRENLGTGIFGAGGSNDIDGFQAIIDTTSTYGNIAVADFAEWVAVSKTNSSVDRPLTLNLLQQTEGALTEGDDSPTVLFSLQNVYDQGWALFQPHQRLMSEEMSALGFKNILTFNGKPWIVDSHCEAQRVLFVNEEYCKLYVHKDEDMRKETIERLETSNSMLMRIFWMGNLVCNNRRFQGELIDIEVAS
jgi:hypothetical protein